MLIKNLFVILEIRILFCGEVYVDWLSLLNFNDKIFGLKKGGFWLLIDDYYLVFEEYFN